MTPLSLPDQIKALAELAGKLIPARTSRVIAAAIEASAIARSREGER